MRLVKVQVLGFGRIRNSSFSADRKLTAVLGPNEAGKSTLLRALLSLNDDSPVPFSSRNRTADLSDETVIVEAEYRLDAKDIEILAENGWAGNPKRLIVKKRAGGARARFVDDPPRHTQKQWSAARAALSLFLNLIDDALAVDDGNSEEDNSERELISNDLTRLRDELESQVVSITPDEMATLQSRITQQLGSTLAEPKIFDPVADATRAILRHPSPSAEFELLLESRRPAFELFTDGDRRLEPEYAFEALEGGAPRALQNLLALAGQSLSQILPDSSRRTAVNTAQDQATDTLEHIFTNAWKQHPISVKLGFESDRLIILVRDRGPGGQTIAFSERSDGLRTFVALTAFLATRGGSVPPILLIDEADTGLHWDAQADLISVLQTSSEVGQIIYTTHSPGCLPPDLGTGVIFVQPDPTDSNSSRIRRDFWSVDSTVAFGASPILFIMGASAAAFSRVRRAVVAEGPSDMLLLPTLFRAATRLSELDFQIVPGISTTSKDRLGGLDDNGVKVAYLVDGDAQGVEWTRQLVEDGGVEAARIKSLPSGLAAEDLFDRDYYLELFLDVAGRLETPAELSLTPGPLKPQLERMCSEEWFIAPPTAVDIAERILSDLDSKAPGEPDHKRVRLSAGSGPALRKLHEEIVTLLNRDQAPTSTSSAPASV
jgi:energy-coupling factor transporter ATP-binding protein EcfA2